MGQGRMDQGWTDQGWEFHLTFPSSPSSLVLGIKGLRPYPGRPAALKHFILKVIRRKSPNPAALGVHKARRCADFRAEALVLANRRINSRTSFALRSENIPAIQV